MNIQPFVMPTRPVAFARGIRPVVSPEPVRFGMDPGTLALGGMGLLVLGFGGLLGLLGGMQARWKHQDRRRGELITAWSQTDESDGAKRLQILKDIEPYDPHFTANFIRELEIPQEEKRQWLERLAAHQDPDVRMQAVHELGKLAG